LKKRHFARELSLQILYNIEISKEDKNRVLEDTKRTVSPNDETWSYATRLIEAVYARYAELDKLIEEKCDNWDLERVAVLDKNILRMAITEILYFDDIPAKVSIDEAIELAKKYSTEKSGTFVNGILDPIAFKK
jgi:N utilization substance protein B